jgi:hypothetical protein
VTAVADDKFLISIHSKQDKPKHLSASATMASSKWNHPSAWRVISVAGASTFLSLVGAVAQKDPEKFNDDSWPPTGTKHWMFSKPLCLGNSLTKFISPSKTAMEGLTATEITHKISDSSPTSTAKEYDFVVIGHGIAGKSAVKKLQELCPQASIAVLDPMMRATTSSGKVEFIPIRCEGFHPLNRRVQMSSRDEIRYQHAILVATGSRGAPPPHYLLDENALGRILELRPTILDNQGTRPILDPVKIRQSVLQAARRGDKVATLGSGWEAVEMAIAVSLASRSQKSSSVLVFGGKGPLSHVLPQYLSAAVAKRLTSTKHNIEIYHRSLIRYVGTDFAGNDDNELTGLTLYTAKSYDLLDAARTAVQWLVGKENFRSVSSMDTLPNPNFFLFSVAPEIIGPMGTATLPTRNVPAYLQSAQQGRAWYQTWSHLCSTTTDSSHANLLACYADDGRIAVNSELSAGNGVYACGSVAKFPNPWTGNADVAGYGVEDGTEAGIVAACNMARDYMHRSDKGLFRFGASHNQHLDLSRDNAHLKHPIPVWRSDTMVPFSSASGNSLKDGGIHALCVGSCDSERFSTQAFWWTNQSKRLKEWLGNDDSSSKSKSRLVRKKTGRLDNNPTSTLQPVYGRGIVFYMDQDAGRIQGVMIWGLPYADNKKGLNATLVKHMEKIIHTNGGYRNLGQDSELERVEFVEFLNRTSRQLVVDAIKPFAPLENIEPADLPRPLVRYTEVRPAGVRRVRVLNRRQEAQGHGFLGEDLFARSSVLNEVPPGPLPNFDNLRELNDTDWEFEASFTREDSKEVRMNERKKRAQALRDWAIWDWYQRRWEENEDLARPPKEESLWLRKGDENRGVSAKERFNDSMMKAIFPEGR